MERSQVDLCVDEGRVDVSVPEQVGDRLQRLPVLEQSRGEAVAEDMRACSGRVQARFTHAVGDHLRNRGGLQRAERRLGGQEDFGVRQLEYINLPDLRRIWLRIQGARRANSELFNRRVTQKTES